MFKKRENVLEIEEGKLLSPKFDNDGLIPVITMCSKTKDILMHGFMNVEALKKTIETKEAYYFSRSRNAIWHKGKTSGFTQKVTEIRIDDDQDSIWLTVDIGGGASCHLGYRSCFYRSIPLGPIDNGRKIEMKFLEKVTRGIQMYELILAEAKNKGDMEKISETLQLIKKYSAILKDIYNSTEPPILYRMKKCLPNVMKNLVTSGVGATSLEIIFDYKKLMDVKRRSGVSRKKKPSILENF